MPSPSQAQPWYVTAFRRDYLERYAHRSQALAAQEIPFLAGVLRTAPGTRILDLCCGAGRYGAGLAATGARVFGVDLSQELLRRAHAEQSALHFVRADMRALPFPAHAFDGIVNLFTSFGYFETDEENAGALREAVRILKPGGVLVLDFFNLEPTLQKLKPHSVQECKGKRVHETRRYDEQRKRIEKTIRIEDAASGPASEMLESVRAFSPEEFERMFQQVGLELLARHGDLLGAPFNRTESPRCVSVGRKRAARL